LKNHVILIQVQNNNRIEYEFGIRR